MVCHEHDSFWIRQFDEIDGCKCKESSHERICDGVWVEFNCEAMNCRDVKCNRTNEKEVGCDKEVGA